MFDVPATTPLFIPDGATRIGVFGKSLPGFSAQIALVFVKMGFIVLDVPATPPIVTTDRATRIWIVGKPVSGLSSQITLVFLFMSHLRPPDPV